MVLLSTYSRFDRQFKPEQSVILCQFFKRIDWIFEQSSRLQPVMANFLQSLKLFENLIYEQK